MLNEIAQEINIHNENWGNESERNKVESSCLNIGLLLTVGLL